MTTPAQIQEAHHLALRQQWANLQYLKINEDGASPEDLALARQVKESPTPEDLDKLLGTPPVTSLFCRGVIYIGEKHG
jgi:hypothetical protein